MVHWKNLPIGHLHYDISLLLRPESFRVLLSCANEGFCYSNLTGITKFKYERRNKKDSGRSNKITPSCKWPIACLQILLRGMGNHMTVHRPIARALACVASVSSRGSYTCQLSRLRRESHACGWKTSISRRLTLAGQFLTPDWKMWVVAVLLDTISKNMLTQTHVRNENHV